MRLSDTKEDFRGRDTVKTDVNEQEDRQIHVGLTRTPRLMCSRIPPYKLVSVMCHRLKPVTLGCFVTRQLIDLNDIVG